VFEQVDLENIPKAVLRTMGSSEKTRIYYNGLLVKHIHWFENHYRLYCSEYGEKRLFPGENKTVIEIY
jgi:hypothetical protein